jgi:hypothetical protein
MLASEVPSDHPVCAANTRRDSDAVRELPSLVFASLAIGG